MALHGNPFLGKLKIPAPDLSIIPDTPFENTQPTAANNSFKRQNKTSTTQEPNTNWQQTDNKSATNRTQTGNKVGTQPATNREQSDNRPILKNTPPLETGNKVGTQPATILATKRQQTENKVTTISPFSSLVGLQRAIMIFLYDSCKTARSRSTDSLTLEHIGSCLKTSPGSVKTTLQRLEEKACVIRIHFKNGRGGWSKYELPEPIFREMLQIETENKLTTKWKQTDNKVGTQPATQPATSSSSSSSFLELENLKTTTTGEPDLFDTELRLAPEWQAIDIAPLTEVGFTQTHLIQIIRQGKLTPTEVQDSIHFFSFDLKRNRKGSELNGSPLNFFMGILRKGIPYAPPENFENPADEARRKVREFKERKERERQSEEQKIMELEFSEWRRGLISDEIVSFVPEFARKPGPLQDSALRTHFEAQIWPNRAQDVLGQTKTDGSDIMQQIQISLQEARE